MLKLAISRIACPCVTYDLPHACMHAHRYTDSMLNFTLVEDMSIANIGSAGNYHITEQDAMGGDLLWTVQGKPCWLSNRGLHLGTSLARPFQRTTFANLNYGTSGQHGIDFFLRVDTNGSLWLGDWGHDNGGFFSCGHDNLLGVQRTTIELAVLPEPPAPPLQPGPSDHRHCAPP